MRLTLKHWLTAFLAAALLAVAVFAVAPIVASAADDDVNITCATASGNYLDNSYVAAYRVPTSMMSFEANGGAANGAPLLSAFDGDWNTYWQTANENKGQGSDNPEFLNAITVKFSKAVTIDSIVYASSEARFGHGYPITLNVYTANGGKLSLYGTCISAATSDRVVFTLKEAITVTQVKFEFRKVNTMHNWTATAKELCFMRPDNASMNKTLDLFDDYAQLTVKDEYRTQLGAIRNGVKNLIGYESNLKPLLDRADAIVNGYLKKDVRREFSTDPTAENVITQYGNLRNYAGNTLKMSSFGINRQVLGIGGMAGQTITVYVEANPGDPLPSIVFTQVYGDWRSWQSSRQLSRGKNVFTVPNLITDNYSRQVSAGGPIHLVNAYEPSQQSSNVKVYVEGGYLYPVFRKGDDAQSFRAELTSYRNKMNEEGVSDVTELVGDHFIHTVGATNAYNAYVLANADPQRNAEKWDDYIAALLEFGGVSMNAEDEHFNEKNLHLYTNFRMVQPWAGAAAFAAGDHIGFITFSEGSMINYGTLGWGIAHEIGHALDVNGRTIGETTNNMWSKFALAYFENNVSRNFNADTTRVLTPDETAKNAGFFNTNTYNYQIWWNLEACHRGFWGNLDNMYRYFDEAAARAAAGVTAEDGTLTTTERMVYYSSLVVGRDLGYYYERFGFSFSTGDNYAPFKTATATNAYKKLVAKALEDGEITDEQFKYWYIDADQYYYDGTASGGYDSTSNVSIVSASKIADGYTLYLEKPEDASAHLGYEIMEKRNGNWYVIGFTNSTSFTDTTKYPNNYVPEYKIRAYDREMNTSAISEAVSFDAVSMNAVCKIGATSYNSISEAVKAAGTDDTILICKSSIFEGAITIDKNITIRVDSSVGGDAVITKSASGPLFTVQSGATLTLGDAEDYKIILDGNAFSQNGALIRVNGGTLRVYNAELRNNINTDHGGAVYNTGNSAFTNVTFKNNTTSINGGAIANFSGGIITLTDCALSGNAAKGNGGALTLDGKTTLVRVTITGNTALGVGGGMYIACNNDARSVSIEGGSISGNTAPSGSVIYHERGLLTLVGGESAAQLSGEIYRAGGTMFISAAPIDLSGVTFCTPTVGDEMNLLAASGNLKFTADYAASINVDSCTALLNEETNTIVIKPITVTVTFRVENLAFIWNYVRPGNLVLPDDLADSLSGGSKYITAWTSNDNSYAAGETVQISGDTVFTAELSSKYAVTVKFDDQNSETYYVIPNTKFYPPVDGVSETNTVVGWTAGGSWYAPAVGIAITADTEIVADTVKLFKVTLKINGKETVSWHEFASSVLLGESPKAPDGKKFSHWDVNGVAYKAGAAVNITSDTVITPKFKTVPDSGLSAGVIALIVIVVVLVVAGAVIIALFIMKRKKEEAAATTAPSKTTNTANTATKKTTDETAKTATNKSAQNIAKTTPTATSQSATKTSATPARNATKPTTPAASQSATRTTPTSRTATRTTPTSTSRPGTRPTSAPTSRPTTRNTPNNTTKK